MPVRRAPEAAHTPQRIVRDVLGEEGAPLDDASREFFEPRFRCDLSAVRVHTGGAAAASARSIRAQAYAAGDHIVFGEGRSGPTRELLAHELVHVVQARRTGGQPTRAVSEPGAADEVEADALAPVAAAGSPLPRIRAAPSARIQRATDEKVGPAKTIPSDRGDEERGFYGTTDKVTYGVRASGPAKPEGLWMDHLFDTQAEAEAYAKDLAAKGELAIREQSGLPYAWGSKTPGGQPSLGNAVTKVYVVEVPAGTPYIQGVVRSQPENLGTPGYVGKTWGGGGAQTVISWDTKTKAVSSFDVEPVTPPPDWVTKTPTGPTVPPAAVPTDDPKTVAKLYSPKLQQEYRSQQILFEFSQTALSNLEAKEAKLKELGGDLSDEDKRAKATLTAQVDAASKRMIQLRKDSDLLDNPAATPQQVQEMLARRGVGVPVTAQKEEGGAKALEGSGISGWGLSDKGLSRQSSTASTRTDIGPDGKPIARTDETSDKLTVGFLKGSRVVDTKTTRVDPDRQVVNDQTKTVGIDLLKGEGSVESQHKTEVTFPDGTTAKVSDKTATTVGVGGVTRTSEESQQVGSKLQSSTSSVGFTREPGQLGFAAAQGTKTGTVTGPEGKEKLEQGVERSSKIAGGLVSDEKGTGLGGTATQERKSTYAKDKSVTTTVAAGGRCQAKVEEVPGSDPPRFTITTTISFDLKLGATFAKDWQAQPGAQKDTGGKASFSAGGGASVGMYAAFKRELSEAEATDYVEFVRQNGRGSSLPEHKLLYTGATQGWDVAKRLWQELHGSPDLLKSLKPGEEVDTNAELGAEAKLGLGAGESGEGGFSIGAEGSGKITHKMRVTTKTRADGKIVLTPTIMDEGEAGLALTVGMGFAGGKVGGTETRGLGGGVSFVLDPKDPAFGSYVAAINAAATLEAVDDFARRHPALVDTRTSIETKGQGTQAGMNLGPLGIDLAGKGKFTGEETRDAQGNLIASRYTGESEGGGTVNLGPIKVGDKTTEKYVGEVDKSGKARGEVSQTTTSTSIRKSVLGAGEKITKDPLGVVLHPEKLVEQETEQQGTAIADPQVMTMCYAALDKSKWDWKVGGNRHDDWVATGRKIRAACVVRGSGRDAEIVSVDKHAVQKALAEWSDADVGGRKELLDSIIRPLGGMPTGKAFDFPDGTENLKPEWDALVVADPLEGARAKVAEKKPQEALGEMQAVRARVTHLYSAIYSGAKKWEGKEIQRAEMLSHITNRGQEIDDAIRNLAKTLPSVVKPSGTPAAVTTVPTADEMKAKEEQEARDRAAELRADLDKYNDNITSMAASSEAVFALLGRAEAKAKDNDIREAAPMIKTAEDAIKFWDEKYWLTYQLYEKLSKVLQLDKARLERLHTAGARGRLKQVYDLTRDPSMAGRM